MPWQDNNPTYRAVPALALIYVQIPKVACTSIRYALAKSAGCDISSDHRDIHDRQYFRDARWTSLGWEPAFFSFAVVRNPWDRLVSLYEHVNRPTDPQTWIQQIDGVRIIEAGMPFEQFARAVCAGKDELANKHYRSQVAFLAPDWKRDKIRAKLLIKFEYLEAGWARLQRRVPALIDLPRMNQTEHADYRTYYTAELQDLVLQRYCGDVHTFGYAF
jgi:hypothetical protein